MQAQTDTTKQTTTQQNITNRFYTTGDFLDLIDALRDFDPGAASLSLTGLLRMASHVPATPAEQTALRIAGLGELSAKEFILSKTAQDMLYDFSTGDYSGNVRPGRRVRVKEEEVEDESPRLTGAVEPVARLCIGGVNYVIGEMTDLDMLAYRNESGGDWLPLANTVEEGWSAIAAEIISLTRDTTREYIKMHMIHRRNAGLGPDIRAFDLHGFQWYIRLNDEGCAVRVDGLDWQPVEIGDLDHELDLGKIAVLSLLTAIPDAESHFRDDVTAWAKRIAAGAMVMPVFNI